jgi:glucuronoarabinoxylan endo-1,4-beta-xylanase
LNGTTCVSTESSGSIALCDGTAAPNALCLPKCNRESCDEGLECVAGVCTPVTEETARIKVDESKTFQELTGIGANLAYFESSVVFHPQKSKIYDAMFGSLGLDIIRFRNRYGYEVDADLSTTAEIVNAATQRLGRVPTVILSSWSPPSSLKANQTTLCQGNDDTCTLTRRDDGSFDYSAYADYWLSSLAAYAEKGVVPEYIGIQNNPDFVPLAIAPAEACRFLPIEGTLDVNVNGLVSSLTFPGYAEALTSVVSRLGELTKPPQIIAPDASMPMQVSQYLDALNLDDVAAIGHHLYGQIPTAPDESQLRDLAEIGTSKKKPLFQTEMQSDGLGTAVMLHHALVTENVTAYLHSTLVTPAPAIPTLPTLISFDESTYYLELPYFAMRHYAAFTDPGWVRVLTDANHPALLTSTWRSPAKDKLTIVLLNTGATALNVYLEFDATPKTAPHVYRTVFTGLERFVDLGSLPENRIVRLPGNSIVTTVVER